MNPMSIMAQAEKLGIPELQRSIQSGVVPAFIGVPLLQEKVKKAKQMQMGMAAQQPKRPSVAEQVGQEAQQATIADIMKDQALRMQGEMGQTGGISDSLPKPEGYAKGGPIGFDEGGEVKHFYPGGVIPGTPAGVFTVPQAYQILQEPTATPEDKFKARQIINNQNMAYTGTEPAINKRAGTLNVSSGSSQIPSYSQNEIKGYLTDAANKYGLDPDMLIAQAQAESSLNPFAKNPKSTSVGVGQFTEGTWKDWGTGNPEDRYNPQLSAEAMAKYNRANIDKWGGDLQKGYASYHLGPNAPEEKLASDTAYTNKILGNTSLLAGSRPEPTQYERVTAPRQEFNPSDYDTLYNPVEELDPRARMEGIRSLLPENKGAEELRSKISKMEQESAEDKERAPWMALMKAGLATMAGTSPYALANIGKGAQEGVMDYIESQKDYRKAQEKRYDMESRLADAKHAEEVAIATKGYDSAEAAKKENKVISQTKLTNKAKIEESNLKNQFEADKANVTSGLTAKQIDATIETHSAENQKIFKIANTIKQDALRRGVDMSDAEALNKASQTLSPYNVERYNHEITKDYENAWQDYLQEKYVGLPSGMNKTQFIEYLTKGSATKPNSGGLQDINGRKTYVAGG